MPGQTGLTENEAERAVQTAYAALRAQGGLMPHAVTEDLVGLDAYRRHMRCPAPETLAAYAGDALPFEEALRVAMHENRCPVCRADIADLRGVVLQDVTQLLSALPAWTTPFVGREAARESLAAALAGGGAPLVTLAAPGGTGKTRLTLELAIEHSFEFPDGVWYVPVGDAGEAPLAAEIARAAGMTLGPGAAPVAELGEFLAGKRALLVLDDVPARSPAAGMLAQLAGGAPDLRCLLTTSGALGVAGERALALPPLQTAGRDVLASESVQLFTEHLRAVEPGRALDEPELLSAAAICERAGGMPLGIELAAARAREMSPRDILKSLTGRGGPPPSGPSESLQDLMHWSYDLLPERERDVLLQLGVFEDGFFAEQAAVVCRTDDIPEILAHLHGKALLQRSEALGRDRYRLLTPVREFARRRLRGERARAVEQRFAVCFLDYARERAGLLDGPRHVEAMQEMSADLPNLRAGMDRAQEAGDWQTAGAYGPALQPFLLLQGQWQECEERLRAADREGEGQARLALARCLLHQGDYEGTETLLRAVAAEAEGRGDMPALARAWYGLGLVADHRGQYTEAALLYDRALKRFEAAGDPRGAADCWQNLGFLALARGYTRRAERFLKQSLAAYRERGDRRGMAKALSNLGRIALDRGRLDEARLRYEESLQLSQETGDVRATASAINCLGMVWGALGDDERAGYCFAEAARRFERLGDRRYLGYVHGNQGDLALEHDDTAGARRHFEAALSIFERIGDAHSAARVLGELARVAQREKRSAEADRLHRESLARLHTLGDAAGVATVLRELGQLAAERDDPERAALLLGVALRLCAERGSAECADVEAALRPLEERGGPAAAAALRERAGALSLDEAVALALRDG